MSLVSAHVLDAVAGRPAVGVVVELVDSAGAQLGRATTDPNGRVVLGPDRLPAGDYRIDFATGAYFAGRQQPTFYPRVSVHFTVVESEVHYHVPLLLSPFAYSSYRGS